MRKYTLFSVILVFISVLISSSCVAKDPVLDVVIEEVKNEIQKERSQDAAYIKKITAFENTLKVYMTDDYPNDKLKEFAKAITTAYGLRMRANKKLYQTYHVIIFQNKKIENKIQLKPIAECLYNNASDQVEVKDLGLGSGKYDVKN